jgi:hypothetical protein
MKLAHAFLSSSSLGQNIVDAHFVRAWLALAPTERAELAPVHADVRGVDVHVLYEIDMIAVLSLGDMTCHTPECEKIVALEKFKPVFTGETLV